MSYQDSDDREKATVFTGLYSMCDIHVRTVNSVVAIYMYLLYIFLTDTVYVLYGTLIEYINVVGSIPVWGSES